MVKIDLKTKITKITTSNNRNLEGLINKTMELLMTTMSIYHGAFILTDQSDIALIKVFGYKSRKKSFWAKVLRLALKSEGLFFTEELEDGAPDKSLLQETGIHAILPVQTDNETLAAVALGKKDSLEGFSREEIDFVEYVGAQIAIALVNVEAFIEKDSRIAELQSLNKMFRHIEHFPDLDVLVQEILDEAMVVTMADGGSLMLIDETTEMLSIKASKLLHTLIALNAKIRIGQGIAGTVAKTRRSLIVNKSNIKRFRHEMQRDDISSAISVPMMADHKLIGVLNLNRKKRHTVFSRENFELIEAFASQAAEAIIKADHYHQIENLSLKNDNQFREFVRALARTVDAKDPYTYGHSEAVTRFSVLIAEKMGLKEEEKRAIEIAGRLHDLGKIGVSEVILNKPGLLSKDEYKSVKRHPLVGAKILKYTDSLTDVRNLILFHHERFDGSGYPDGLKGEEIPLSARILTVADSFDTMMSKRPYRDSLTKAQAIEELTKCSGTQFDPKIVETFLGILRSKKLHVTKHFFEIEPDKKAA
ncbi:MAG: GAF domain-containing protein [Actinomycetia bacterium]|nr:GAF domain-containing protein [Actinomycetes bacterium]